MSEPLLPLLRAYAAERRRTLTEHPTPDELLDYYLEDGTPEQRERLQDHLALCPDCARALLDLAAFPDVAPATGGEGPLDTATAWTRLRERTFIAAPVVRHPGASRRRARALSLIAASLLLASLSGFGGFYLGGLGQTSGNVVTDQLEVATERGAGDLQDILVPDWADRLALTLLPEDPQEFSTFEVELRRLNTSVWSRTVRRDLKDQVSIELTPRDIPSGVYTLHLYGVGKGGERTPILKKQVDLEWHVQQD